MSFLVTRPPRPDPGIDSNSPRGISFSRAILKTIGVKKIFPAGRSLFGFESCISLIGSSTLLESGPTVFPSAGFTLFASSASVSILAMTLPTSITSFSAARISTKVPDTAEGISESTLSVPISRNNSSFSTKSPTFFRHSRTVPSMMDSPIFGIIMSTIINIPLNR